MTWEWMPGMRTKSRVRVVEVEDDGYTTGLLEKQGYVIQVMDGEPDWNDPATKGCLLEQVRQVRGEPGYYPTALAIEGGEVVWVVEKPGPVRQTRYSSEAEALLAALRAVKSFHGDA